MWNYCTVGDASLDIFTFDLYDQDGSGILSIEEMGQILHDIYGAEYKRNPKAKAVAMELKKLDSKAGMNIDSFKKFAKTHGALLFPVFQLQFHLRTKILGPKFWDSAAQRRIMLSKGKYVTIHQLMEMHLHPDLYQQVMGSDTKSAKLNAKALNVIKNTGTVHGRQKANDDDSKVYAAPPDEEEDAPPSEAPPPSHEAHHSKGRGHHRR